MRRAVCGAAAAILLCTLIFATTWFPKEITCPLCGEKNEFMEIASYGNYIYRWPSKFQFIFWPDTDPNVLYCCKKCGLTCFMWDFESVPKEKFDELREALKDVHYKWPSPSPEELDKSKWAMEKVHPGYGSIPMTERLAVAEKVYKTLGRDDEFWCRFYRIAGYHAEEEGKTENAAAARKKALEIAQSILKKENMKGRRKEFLLISGAMNFVLGSTEAAEKDFTAAKELKYSEEGLSEEENKGKNGYLDYVLDEFTRLIKERTAEAKLKKVVLETLQGKPDELAAITAPENIWKKVKESRGIVENAAGTEQTADNAQIPDVPASLESISKALEIVRVNAAIARFDWDKAEVPVIDVSYADENERGKEIPLLKVLLVFKSGQRTGKIVLSGVIYLEGAFYVLKGVEFNESTTDSEPKTP